MNPQDALALQIGRTILDLHIAKQTIVTQAAQIEGLQEQVEDLEARLAERQESVAGHERSD